MPDREGGAGAHSEGRPKVLGVWQSATWSC
jgi:hypothetical protein